MLSLKKYFKSIAVALSALIFPGAVHGQTLPVASMQKVNFATQIRPIFESSCAKCHLNGAHRGEFRLDSRETFLKGGESEEPAAIVHDSANSRIIRLLTATDPDDMMPKKSKRLSDEQIGLVRAWIDQGMAWDAPATKPTTKFVVAALAPRRPTIPPATLGSGLENPVDRILAPYFQQHGITPPSLIEDRVYARRVYLDIVGMLPSPAELQSFIRDTRPDKRRLLVRRLLSDTQRYVEHWLSFWNDALRNDYRGPGYIDGGRKPILGFLYRALADNMPYDEFVRQLINPTPESEGFVNGIIWRGAVSASQGKEIQAAQNISQVFVGLNMKCNSCHDSFISDWKLSDAYGLAGVYSNKPMEMFRCEKPTGKIAPVKFIFPELGTIDADAPREQRVAQLARIMTSQGNGRLTRTIVNRLWARFFGHGIVEPVDEMDQAPWNADLLDWLAVDLSDHHYDLKKTIERILTSRAYQLPPVAMHEIDDRFVFAGPVVRRMSAEQFSDAVATLTGDWHTAPASTAALNLPPFALPARWIWNSAAANTTAQAGRVYFRKIISLKEKPAAALATIAADNRYVLYVNGVQVAEGHEFGKPTVVDLSSHLVKGQNLVAVMAENDPPAPVATTNQAPATAPTTTAIKPVNKRSRQSRRPASLPATVATTSPATRPADNPAGLWIQGSMSFAAADDQPRSVVEFGTDASWQCSTGATTDWQKLSGDSRAFYPAFDLGAMALKPWDLPAALVKLKTPYTLRYQRTRAVWANNDALMTALGRPNREQVVTHRSSVATMLQALELTNGRELSEMMDAGASYWMGKRIASSDQLVRRIYLGALGRDPTPAEAQMSVELIGSPARQDGVEDLLWSIVMLPEFQLIH
jgi:mono/diheme cytochrome c family protein